MSSYQTPLIKLISLLILLPWTVTYLHLYEYIFWQYEYCFVGPSARHDNIVDNHIRSDRLDDAFTLYGIYAPIHKKKKKGDEALDGRSFRQKYSSMIGHRNTATLSLNSGWPSLTQAVMMISAPSSTLSKYSYINAGQEAAIKNHEIVFDESNMWCLQSGGEDKWCSSPLQNYPKGTIHQYPPSGLWYHSKTESKPPIVTSCPAPTTTLPSKKSKHKKQNGRQNQNVQFLLRHPTTTLLMLLNIGLAYQYWNHRISPSSVSKSYNKICIEHEWWRSFTGATAHFEPLHLGFNMMSLYTLGKELEGGFGSIVFLVYNVALCVMCTGVMMAMVHCRLIWERYNGNSRSEEREMRLKETSSVGYSGVLFALMVITTMERSQPTCPIPFFSDVCFATHNVPGLPWLRFNIAPIVSLFVAQFIMPRVSFMGHLAGIACGFGLHWGWGFPPLELCSPNALIGFCFGCLMIFRQIITPLSNESMDGENPVMHLESGEELEAISDGDGVTDPFMRGKQRKKEREMEEVLRKQRTLGSIRNLTGIMAAASMLLFGVTSSLVLSQLILFGYFTCGSQITGMVWNKKADSEVSEQKHRAGVIWRGYIVASTLAIAMDSMSMAAIVILKTLISSERPLKAGLVPACIFLLLRIAVNCLGLITASKILFDFSQVGDGVFVQLFSFVVSSSKRVGDEIFLSHSPLWTAFEGKGVRLGSRTT